MIHRSFVERIILEEFYITGHENIRGTHNTTIEFTKDSHLTLKGDCIIGVKSEKGLLDFSNEFKKQARSKEAVITCKIIVGDIIEKVRGYGDPKLTFKDPQDIVIRKSNYVCDRTAMIKSNKAATDLSEGLINQLKVPKVKAKVIFTIES
ncbi:MAG: DUF371 domain-containing protein [Candidatus Lokiarchaeota archaeon]|nr:DUF371 domain-containing protein [Candidatus Lokiarchaeota archaeon]